jgi:hypothetical protein
MDAGVVPDIEPVTGESPFREQVVDKIPGEIYQFVDGRFNSCGRHTSMAHPGTNRTRQSVGVSCVCDFRALDWRSKDGLGDSWRRCRCSAGRSQPSNRGC